LYAIGVYIYSVDKFEGKRERTRKKRKIEGVARDTAFLRAET